MKFKKRIFKKEFKRSCVIINPGKLSEEVYNDPFINEKFKFRFFHVSESDDNFKKIVNFLDDFDIILFDHTGVSSYNSSFLEALNKLNLGKRKLFNIISFYESITGRIPLVHINQDWVLNSDLFLMSQKSIFLRFKRFVDLAVSVLILPISILLTSIGMILIKVSSPGPVMFKQQRVGKDGQPFTIYKLRTMVYNSKGHTAHTVAKDARIFPIGLFLRKTKIDELPQLLNVFKGEMSLIGPRPEKVDIVESLSKENPYYPLRHLIRPGITGWAQVNQPKATPNENLQKLEFDLYYIKNSSYFLEFEIFWRTFKVILKRDSL